MPLFDTYVFVDWSAKDTPAVGRDSIWIATGDHNDSPIRAENVPTRSQARLRLAQLLRGAVEHRRRVLVGLDFPYGYPRGLAQALEPSGPEPAWRRTWGFLEKRIQEEVGNRRNSNNRFGVAADANERLGLPEGPFWGKPQTRGSDRVPRTRPRFERPGMIGEFRLTERHLRDHGMIAKSCWQLFGAGSVGSQALVGIPVLAALRSDPALRGASQVWPMETGFGFDGLRNTKPMVVHAEIWPGLLRPTPAGVVTRDELEIRAFLQRIRELDADDRLDRLFASPPGLSSADATACEQEEGWILGTSHPELFKTAPTLEDAIALAAGAHFGQRDKAGERYVLHPLRIMLTLQSDTERMVAVLHDLVEDTGMTLQRLRTLGYSPEIVEAVDHLTKREGEEYSRFIARAKRNPLARRVKMADLRDNLDEKRLRNMGPEDHARMEKYRRALQELERAEGSTPYGTPREE